jgi:hypothetical protein
MSSLTRGPLPARVYWRRRIVVLGSALLLVFAFARLLGAGSDASSGTPQAAQVAADESPSSTAPTSATPTVLGPLPSGNQGKAPVLAEPTGPCDDEDIAVTPEVEDAVAGQDVAVKLRLRTLEEDACTWRVSRKSLTLKITSGHDEIWSTRECPRAMPARDVIVRREHTATVGVTWDAKRSDDTCSRMTAWAMPGWYHIEAAALAGEPTDQQFELKAPTAPVITRSPSPHQKPQQSKSSQPNPEQSKPSGRPVASSGSSGSVD